MKKEYSDEDLKEILGNTKIENAVIDDRITRTLESIRRQEKGEDDVVEYESRAEEKSRIKQESEVKQASRVKHGSNAWIRIARGFGAVAAAFLLVFGLGATNPALAAEIPVFGSIFERVWNVFSYGRMPEEKTVQLREDSAGTKGESDSEENFPVGAESAISDCSTKEHDEEDGIGSGTVQNNNSAYQDSDNGFRITFTEYYATNQAIYLGVRVESEEELPALATMGDTNYQLMQMHAKEDYSFREDTISNAWRVEGRQEDAHTFVGIMRIDYENINVDSRRYNAACEEADEKGEPYPEVNADTYDDWFDVIEVPHEFDFDMQIYRIWTYSRDLPTRYEKKGEWNFSFHIEQSDAGIRSVQVDEVNEQGIGVDHIELTPVELSVYTTEPGDGMYYTVALDKNGLALPGGNAYRSEGAIKNEMIIGSHDISTITVYICDYDAYMEIDNTLITPGEFRERLEEVTVFKTEVRMEE